MPLPPPDQPYESLNELLVASIEWGRRNQIPEVFSAFMDQAFNDNIKRGIFEGPRVRGPRKMRPSANLSCQGIVAMTLEQLEADPIPQEKTITLNLGHQMHGEMYSALTAGLPDGLRAIFEYPVQLPDWWPEDPAIANHTGHIDVVLYCDDLGPEYINPALLPECIILDVKSTTMWGVKKYAKTEWHREMDAFGYVSQLSIYSDALGTLDAGAFIIALSRNNPDKPPTLGYCPPSRLYEEVELMKQRLESEWAPEHYLRYAKKDVEFQCGNWATGKSGFCNYVDECQKRRQNLGFPS